MEATGVNHLVVKVVTFATDQLRFSEKKFAFRTDQRRIACRTIIFDRRELPNYRIEGPQCQIMVDRPLTREELQFQDMAS